MDVSGSSSQATSFFHTLSDKLTKHIFTYLDGGDLSVAREVCRKWNELACREELWKRLCLKRLRSLETDKHLWKLIDPDITSDLSNCWRKIYPNICTRPQWHFRLQKTENFICSAVAHHVSGPPLSPDSFPEVLVVERRFNIQHLDTFVLPDASCIYLEPEQDCDLSGFNDFIDYLAKRDRAGLALEDQLRFVIIPPCDYAKSRIGYNGDGLLLLVQSAYPPLVP